MRKFLLRDILTLVCSDAFEEGIEGAGGESNIVVGSMFYQKTGR